MPNKRFSDYVGKIKLDFIVSIENYKYVFQETCSLGLFTSKLSCLHKSQLSTTKKLLISEEQFLYITFIKKQE